MRMTHGLNRAGWPALALALAAVLAGCQSPPATGR
ncbi:lytic transglycosylase domain-containing protein [Variovorax sp. E3]|nr:lytic transglycosylase domain-containing protein [Variovorax sp. E3]